MLVVKLSQSSWVSCNSILNWSNTFKIELVSSIQSDYAYLLWISSQKDGFHEAHQCATDDWHCFEHLTQIVQMFEQIYNLTINNTFMCVWRLDYVHIHICIFHVLFAYTRIKCTIVFKWLRICDTENTTITRTTMHVYYSINFVIAISSLLFKRIYNCDKFVII